MFLKLTSKTCLSRNVCRGSETQSMLDKQNSKCFSSNACLFGRGFTGVRLCTYANLPPGQWVAWGSCEKALDSTEDVFNSTRASPNIWMWLILLAQAPFRQKLTCCFTQLRYQYIDRSLKLVFAKFSALWFSETDGLRQIIFFFYLNIYNRTLICKSLILSQWLILLRSFDCRSYEIM